ncbi:hypothetical protein [Palleronia sp. THAF1]|uniref:hypothetical protein n=1 Tax=Palleronia sp. THAF1 TaxID=2587842 RepID=UPI000F53A06E|nr:hypothetical protein [Palleronia sp. THAF1]
MSKTLLAAKLSVSVLAMPVAAQDLSFPGFAISVDGQTIAGDPRVAVSVPARQADVDLAKADIRVQYDSLYNEPALALLVLDAPQVPVPGATVRVASRLNYPAFVTRGELLIYSVERGRLRQVARRPLTPGGEASFVIPQGEEVLLTHRVFDAEGRYDETAPVTIFTTEAADGGRADGTPATATVASPPIRRRIPLRGGTVTVSGSDVRDGATVSVLGETVVPDADGTFVVQRILPPGELPVAVQVNGAGEDTDIERFVTIPRAEWFYTAIADLTFGKRFDPGVTAAGVQVDDTYSYGRLAGFAKGRLASGWEVTTRFDSGEEEFDEIFDGRDNQDVAAILDRLDYDEVGYSEFGDDSVIEDGAPSRGKFFGRIERDGNHLMWGDFEAGLGDNRLLRNTRTLYGAQGVYRSADTTENGDARLSVEAYAAQPDRLPGRDIFRGTGGSLYFLRQQDISVGSETISIEIRDAETGRLISTRRLVEGRDYDVNYIQGVIILSRPLQGSVDDIDLIDQPGAEYTANLVAQYEFTPTAGNIQDFAYGARVEGWVADDLRLGLTGMVENTGTADQTATGADLLWQIGEQSALRLDYARTDGPGFGASVSQTGGLGFTDIAPVVGSGHAVQADVSLDFADLGLAAPGRFDAFYQERTAGFSTLDQQITVDERSSGLAVEMEPSDALRWRVYYEQFRDDAGRRIDEGGAEIGIALNDRIALAFGVEHVDKQSPTAAANDTGRRTDVAARVTVTPSERLSYYGFAQGTVDHSGGLERNNRIGVGANWAVAQNWRLEAEVSGGNQGAGGELLASYANDAGTTAYAGYRLEPGRELNGITLSGRDRGQFVIGGTRKLTDYLGIRAENTVDLFGDYRSVANLYGVDWDATEALRFDATAEIGRITDRVTGDIDRTAFSLGVAYDRGDDLTARARLELRRDRGEDLGVSQDQDAVLVTADVAWKIDDARRLSFGAEYADIDSDNGNLAEGTFAQVALGYAIRPTLDDRFNLLFQYRYLEDLVGQEVNGTAGQGPRQRSHVLSVDGEYDLNKRLSLGAKVGLRLSESAPGPGFAFADNDAWLAIGNLRYHIVKNWDGLFELRHLQADQGGFQETGALATVYRHLGRNAKVGIGFNFGEFSDNLTDLTYDDRGAFLNVIAKF